MHTKALPGAFAALLVGLCVVACGSETTDDLAEREQALVACAANELDEIAATEPAPVDPVVTEDALLEAGGIRIMGVLDDTGCSSITISDPRKKHPTLPIPLPKDWNTRCPSYGPPKAPAIDPTKCTTKSPTLLECSLAAGGKNITFECRRDTPGGKGKAGGVACNFHCYVKEGQK